MGLKVVFPDLGVRESGLELIFLKPFEGWRRQHFYTFSQQGSPLPPLACWCSFQPLGACQASFQGC